MCWLFRFAWWINYRTVYTKLIFLSVIITDVCNIAVTHSTLYSHTMILQLHSRIIAAMTEKERDDWERETPRPEIVQRHWGIRIDPTIYLDFICTPTPVVHNDNDHHHYMTTVNIAQINIFITKIIYYVIKLPELVTAGVHQNGGVSRHKPRKWGPRDIFEIWLSQDIETLSWGFHHWFSVYWLVFTLTVFLNYFRSDNAFSRQRTPGEDNIRIASTAKINLALLCTWHRDLVSTLFSIIFTELVIKYY